MLRYFVTVFMRYLWINREVSKQNSRMLLIVCCQKTVFGYVMNINIRKLEQVCYSLWETDLYKQFVCFRHKDIFVHIMAWYVHNARNWSAPRSCARLGWELRSLENLSYVTLHIIRKHVIFNSAYPYL